MRSTASSISLFNVAGGRRERGLDCTSALSVGNSGGLVDFFMSAGDINSLVARAEEGSVVAQSILGISHLYGIDVSRNLETALRWLTSASEQGSSRAMFHLGRMHEEGWGAPRDFRRAGLLYQQAADHGEWMAYVCLARMFRHGRGIDADSEAALAWYQTAVDESESIAPCPELDEAREFLKANMS